MEKEIMGLINSFDLSIKFNEIRIKAILNVLQKTNPGLRDLYEFELYRISKDFQASLSPEKLTEYENFGYHFPNSD